MSTSGQENKEGGVVRDRNSAVFVMTVLFWLIFVPVTCWYIKDRLMALGCCATVHILATRILVTR
jgi:hypothetical protein